MCHKCETKNREEKKFALEQVKEILETMDPDAEFLLFTANVKEHSAEQGTAICGMAGALTGVGMAALLSELHTQVEGDPGTLHMAMKFMNMRKEQTAARKAKEKQGPLDVSPLIRTSDHIH